MAPVRKMTEYYWYLDGVSSRDLVMVVFDKSGRQIKHQVVKNGSYTEKLLPNLVKLLGFKKNTVPKGIVVLQGSGSYSQIRLICATVNALAFAWGIKVATTTRAPAKIASPVQYKWQRIIWPKYSGPGVG